ncbi:hypothetical protein IAT38_003070 [Cryptococcus sp. DSM 104549]
MPVPLGKTDTFNSSGATIIPDRRPNTRSTRSTRSSAAAAAANANAPGANANSGAPAPFPQQSHSYLHQPSAGRALGPQNSMERRFINELGVTGGDDGILGLLQDQDGMGNPLAGWSFMNFGNTNLPPSSQEERQRQGQNDFLIQMEVDAVPDPSAMLSPSLSTSSHPSHHSNHSPFQPTAAHLANGAPAYRPSTAQSFHSGASSSLDHSEFYETTDIGTEDEDDLMGGLGGLGGTQASHGGRGRPGLQDAGGLGDLGLGEMGLGVEYDAGGRGLEALGGVGGAGVGGGTEPPDVAVWLQDQRRGSAASVGVVSPEVISPQDLNGRAGFSPDQASVGGEEGSVYSGVGEGKGRGKKGRAPSVHDQDVKRQMKLEHRRDINRRSAQKHRARRREELDTLAQTVADKDKRIAQLERELEVEKARSSQLRDMYNAQLERNGR